MRFKLVSCEGGGPQKVIDIPSEIVVKTTTKPAVKAVIKKKPKPAKAVKPKRKRQPSKKIKKQQSAKRLIR